MNLMLSLYLKFNQKGGEMMAVIYATLIIKGKKIFAQVPKILKEKVKEILTDLDMAELAVE
nr:MAG TPA: hypothetical protein [Caudoviricetes sp.]